MVTGDTGDFNMRLWHYELIPYLPNSQLIAQWRELNSIFKKQDNHLLINYVYDYQKEYLWSYTQLVIDEMEKRNFKIHSWENYNEYFKDTQQISGLQFFEHDSLYFTICYYNLFEKFMCGQKDFSYEQFKKLKKFYERYGD
jgi:uncharacterized protein (TIGR02328 family)